MTDQQALTESEQDVFAFLTRFGEGIDFGGRGADRKMLNAARALEQRGLIRDYRGAFITEAGRKALAKGASATNKT